MKISKHARQRMLERLGVRLVSEQNELADLALKKGLKLKRFKGSLYEYLSTKQLDYGTHTLYVLPECRGVFVFENGYGGTLCTVYIVPDEFGPIEDYIVRSGDCTRCFIALCNDEAGLYEFVGEGVLVEDIAEATEFRSHESAQNCIKNNKNVARRIKMGWDVEIIDL